MSEFMELMEADRGWHPIGDIPRGEGYDAKLAEAVKLINNSDGRPEYYQKFKIQEAMTTSDFPYLFGDVLDRQLLAAYKGVDPVWKAFTRMSTNKDFKASYRFAITGGDQYLARVGEKGEYLASGRGEAKYEMTVLKYGRQFDISWESLINDDLGALKDTPARFARAAVRTEHRLVTGQYARNALFSAGTGNAANIELTIANLETGVETFQSYLDAAGEPIMARAKYLVVPPCLEFTARQILSSATKMWTDDAGGVATAWPTANVISQTGLQLIVDPYLGVYGGADILTQWYLFPDPNDIAMFEFAHLSGHERPEICMKASDKVSVGGGAVGPFSGDFATDNVFYRVRMCAGVCTLDWRGGFMGGSTLA